MKTKTQTVNSFIKETVSKNVRLSVQVSNMKAQRQVMLRIIRKQNVYLKRAAKRLDDPLAVKLLDEIEREVKALQADVKENG